MKNTNTENIIIALKSFSSSKNLTVVIKDTITDKGITFNYKDVPALMASRNDEKMNNKYLQVSKISENNKYDYIQNEKRVRFIENNKIEYKIGYDNKTIMKHGVFEEGIIILNNDNLNQLDIIAKLAMFNIRNTKKYDDYNLDKANISNSVFIEDENDKDFAE